MNVMKRFCRISFLILAVSVCCLLPISAYCAVIGTLQNVAGNVDLLRGGALPALAAKNGDKVATGDLIRTKSAAFAEVAYNDGTVLRISQRSRIDIGEHFSGDKKEGSEVRLARGKVQALVDLSKTPGSGAKKFEIKTPNAIAGVRGTNFFVSHERSVTSVYVKEGRVYSFNPIAPKNIVNLTPGTITNISGKNLPSKPFKASGQDVKQFESGMTPPPPGAQSGGKSSGGPGPEGGGGGSRTNSGSAASGDASGGQQGGTATTTAAAPSNSTGGTGAPDTSGQGSSGTPSGAAPTGTGTGTTDSGITGQQTASPPQSGGATPSSTSGTSGTGAPSQPPTTPAAFPAGGYTPPAGGSPAAAKAAADAAADAAAKAAAEAAARAAAEAAAKAAAEAAARAAAEAAAEAARKAAEEAAKKIAEEAARRAAAEAAAEAARQAAILAAQQEAIRSKPTTTNVKVRVNF